MVNFTSAQAVGDYFFHMGPENTTSLFYAKVFVKKNVGDSLAIGVAKRNNTDVVYTPFSYALNTTYLIAVKYTFNAGTITDDEVKLWVNPVLNGIEPAATLTQTDLGEDALSLGMLALRQGSTANAAVLTLGGIRIANTWIPEAGSTTFQLTVNVSNGWNMVSIPVILLHQGTLGANQRDWEPFAHMIAARGYTAATLDFRGRGYSKGDMTQIYNLIWDMQALMEYLKGIGFQRFVCMGASMGGSTCLRAAVEYNLEGVVVIGSYLSNGAPTSTSTEELPALSMPKLFITTEQDVNPEIPIVVREMYHIAQEPKQLSLFPGEAHGTEMFNEAYGQEFTALLMAG